MKRRLLVFISVSVSLVFMALLATAMSLGQLRPSSQIAYISPGVHDIRRLMLEDLSNNVRVELAEYPSMNNTPLLWSPDGEWLASWRFALVQPALYVMKVRERREYVIPMTGVYGYSTVMNVPLAFSPDSTRLVYIDYISPDNSEIRVLDLHTGESRALGAEISPQSMVAWPQDGPFVWRYLSTIAGVNQSQTRAGPGEALLLWANPDSDFWLERPLEPACSGFVPFPAVSPDGRSFVCPVAPANNDVERVDLFLYDLSTPGSYSAHRLTAERGRAEFVSWAPDGRTLAFYARREQNTDIFLLDIETGTQTRITIQTSQDTNPAWSPDGRSIVYTAYERAGNRDLFVYDLDRQTRRQLTTHPAIEDNARWSPDGRWILFSSNRLTGNRGDLLYVIPAVRGMERRLQQALPIAFGQSIESVAAWRP